MEWSGSMAKKRCIEERKNSKRKSKSDYFKDANRGKFYKKKEKVYILLIVEKRDKEKRKKRDVGEAERRKEGNLE